jgi:aryl-alcohol dehydrogenase-like predicted oxidoreductase
MDYRQLGSSGLQISAMTLGTMTFGGEGNWHQRKTASDRLSAADLSLLGPHLA